MYDFRKTERRDCLTCQKTGEVPCTKRTGVVADTGITVVLDKMICPDCGGTGYVIVEVPLVHK